MTGYSFNPQAPTVIGFLGSITFASMILMMQFSNELQFSEYLIPLTAASSFLFIMASIGSATDQRYSESTSIRFSNLVKFCTAGGLYSLLVIIPGLLYSFSPIGAGIIAILETIIMVLFVKWNVGAD